MKKILFFINELSGGGAEKVLLDMVNLLDENKYNITVQTLCDKGIYKERLNKNIKYKTILKNSGILKNSFVNKIVKYLLLFIIPPKLVYKAFVKSDYDIEVAYLEGFPTKLISSSTSSAEKYAWVHIDMYNYDHNKKLFKSEEDIINSYKKFDKIFCVSDEVRRMFNKRFGSFDNVYTQYNVLDEEAIIEKSLEASELEKTDRIRMVTVGRISDQKGYDRLINICDRLNNDGFDFELLIVGDGPDKDVLEKQVVKKSLGDKVKFLGFQKNPYKYMKDSDLFVCSSRAEGFSTVATEAVILGLPVVTTDCAGMRDLLGDSEYGLIVDNSEDGIYSGLRTLIENRDMLTMYKKKSELRSEDFTKKKRIEEIEKALDNI